MKALIIIISGMLFLSCQHDMNSGPFDKAFESGIQLQVDLQQGFDGMFVRVEINGEEQFRSVISEMAPLSGPLASFTSQTFQKRNRITVYWRCLDQDCTTLHDSHEINLEGLEKYYIGISASGDAIILQVQDQPFYYL